MLTICVKVVKPFSINFKLKTLTNKFEVQWIIEVRVGGTDAVDDGANGDVSRDEDQSHQGAGVKHRLAGARADRPPHHHQRQGEGHPGNEEVREKIVLLTTYITHYVKVVLFFYEE